MRNLFKSTEINIGTIKANSKNNPVQWEFDELRRTDIATYLDGNKWEYAIEKSCSCQGEVQVSDAGISLSYNDKGTRGLITKQITVYLTDPNKQTKIINDRGESIYNPELGYQILKFIVNVE